MPRHVRGADQPSVDVRSLTTELLHELQDPQPFGQPIILEDRTPETSSMRVHVIWDRWEGCLRRVRSAVIADAYRSLNYIQADEQLTVCLGLTVPEAVSIGLLPYEVVSARRRDESPSLAEYRQAILQVGASTLSSGEHPRLRFAALEDAEAAMEHLLEKLPGSKWIIKQEVSVPGD